MKKILQLIVLVSFPLVAFTQTTCFPGSAFDYLNINNVNARINNGGDMWWDLVASAKYIVPKSGNVSSLFAGSLWIGGIDAGGNVHMAAQTYRQTGNDYFPGPLDASGNVSSNDCSNFDRIWKVNKSTIDSFKAGLFGNTDADIPVSIKDWPARNNPNDPFVGSRDLAPFVDVDGDGIYDPINGDYPSIQGDQALWWVFNDAGDIHTETSGLPLKIEVQAMAYAYKGTDPSDCLYNTTFYHFKIINKSSASYNNTFLAWWTDPDLGCYTDDYIGCDTSHQLGVVYNDSAYDGGNACGASYGNQPPIEAIDVLRGPTDENGNIHGMDRFMLYGNNFSTGGNPETAPQYYNYMNSIYKDGTHLSFDNKPVNYIYSGDPSVTGSWSMCNDLPASEDVRMLASSGPFLFNPGDEKTLDFAVIWTQNVVYPCPSFSSLYGIADCVKNTFASEVFTGIPSVSSEFNFSVVPNPVKNGALLTFKTNQMVEHMKIWNLTGSLIREFSPGSNEFTLRSDLTPGIYFYQAQMQGQKIATGKFIVQ